MSAFRRPFKLVLLGDSGVGKSCALLGLKQFHEEKNVDVDLSAVTSTLGVDFVSFVKNNLSIQAWDTAGMEKYQSITKCFVRNANVCLLVFDSSESLQNCTKWFEILKDGSQDCEVVLVQTKMDLGAHINEQEIHEKTQQFNASYFISISCISGHGVELLLDTAFKLAVMQSELSFDVPKNKRYPGCKVCCV